MHCLILPTIINKIKNIEYFITFRVLAVRKIPNSELTFSMGIKFKGLAKNCSDLMSNKLFYR